MAKNTTTMSNAQATYDGLTPEDVYGIEGEDTTMSEFYEACSQEDWVRPQEDLPVTNLVVLALVCSGKAYKYYLATLNLGDEWTSYETKEAIDVTVWQYLPEIPEGG